MGDTGKPIVGNLQREDQRRWFRGKVDEEKGSGSFA